MIKDFNKRKKSVTLANIAIDASVQDALDVATSNAYAIPDIVRLLALNKLIKKSKEIGFYQLTDTLVNFAYASTALEQFSRIDIKNPTNEYILNGSLDYQKNGYKGLETDGYLQTGFNPAINGVNYTLDNAGRGIVCFDGSSNIISGVAGNSIERWYSSGTASFMNSTNSLSETYPAASTGYYSMKRISAENVEITIKDAEYLRQQTSTSLHNYEKVLFRAWGSYSSRGISLSYEGAAIPFDIEQKFRLAYNEYLVTIGLNPIS